MMVSNHQQAQTLKEMHMTSGCLLCAISCKNGQAYTEDDDIRT